MTVEIGGENLNRWGIVTDVNIGSPETDVRKIYVPGHNGELDFTEALTGEAVFKNRPITISMVIVDSDKNLFRQKMTELKNHLHGRQHNIIFSDDNGFYYKGRCSIEEKRLNRARGDVTITIDAYPYKLKNQITEVSADVSGSATLVCSNLRRSVVPEITATAEMSLAFDTKTFAIPAGTSVLPELRFTEGDNVVTVTGTGNITFKYQEGSL